MSEKLLNLSSIYGDPRTAIFSPVTGRKNYLSGYDRASSGNYYESDGNFFALFVDDGVLYFRWNEKQWDVKSLKGVVSYLHDFSKRITCFSVGNLRIEYPAWWRDDPVFDPNLPELDEQEDYLGYVYSVVNNDQLQKSLIASWKA